MGGWFGALSVILRKAGVFVGARNVINFIEGSGITLTVADNSGTGAVDVTIDASGGSGETNTASNEGTLGVGVFSQKVGVDLRFKDVASNNLSVSEDSNKNIIVDSPICPQLIWGGMM